MANLKEIRTRIASIKSTQQVTSAMKMVSAAKLRRSQDAIIQLRPYAEKLVEILSHISRDAETAEDNMYARQRAIDRVLIVAITSNRGLCGAFNANVVKKVSQLLEEDYLRQYENNAVDIISIGKRAADILKTKKIKVTEQYNELLDNLSFNKIIPFADTIMNMFVSGKYDRIDLVYNQFKNAAVQVLTHEQFLPIKVEEEQNKVDYKSDYIFEPSEDYIVDVLIPKSLKIQFFKALLDSNAAEHGARMTAMHQATDNATDIIKDLQLTYNKARQAAITKELVEIVGGAEALNT